MALFYLHTLSSLGSHIPSIQLSTVTLPPAPPSLCSPCYIVSFFIVKHDVLDTSICDVIQMSHIRPQILVLGFHVENPLPGTRR